MIFLSGSDLRQAHKNGDIKFTPDIEPNQFRQASIDLRLGYKVSIMKPLAGLDIDARSIGRVVANKDYWQKRELKDDDGMGRRENFVIEPNEFIIAETLEHVYVPLHLAGLVEGRSSFARAGLSVHQSAPLLNPGWQGHITLEFFNSGTKRITMTPVEVLPCSVSFVELKTPLKKEEGYGQSKRDTFQGRNSQST